MTMSQLPSAKDLRAAGALIQNAENLITKRMQDMGLKSGRASVYAYSDGVRVSLNAGEKVFLHPTGRRIYESIETDYSFGVDRNLKEVAEWLAKKKAK